MHPHLHCSIVFNSQDMEATELSIDGWTSKEIVIWGFPGGAVVENLPANAGDTGSSPGLGRFHMPQSD